MDTMPRMTPSANIIQGQRPIATNRVRSVMCTALRQSGSQELAEYKRIDGKQDQRIDQRPKAAPATAPRNASAVHVP